MDQWFYLDGGARRGPLSTDALIGMLLKQAKPHDTMIWREGHASWQPVAEVEEISRKVPPPGPQVQDSSGALLPLDIAEDIARLYRRMLILFAVQMFGVMLVSQGTGGTAGRGSGGELLMLCILLPTALLLMITGYRLANRLDSRAPWAWSLGMLVPGVSLLSLYGLSNMSAKFCKTLGLEVGLLGPSREGIERLRSSATISPTALAPVRSGPFLQVMDGSTMLARTREDSMPTQPEPSGSQPQPTGVRDSTLLAIALGIGLLTALQTSTTSHLPPVLDRINSVVINGTFWAAALLVTKYARRGQWRRVLACIGLAVGVFAGAIGFRLLVIRSSANAATAPKGTGDWRVSAAPLEVPTGSPDEPIGMAALTPSERNRFERLIVDALKDPERPTRDDRVEMSLLMRKMSAGKLSTQDLERALRPAREKMTGAAIKYQALFWDDARQAFHLRRPTKSVERETYEKESLAAGDMSEFRIRQNETFMESIAYRRPVTLPDGAGTMVMSEDIIEKAAASVAASSARIERLLTPIEVPAGVAPSRRP